MKGPDGSASILRKLLLEPVHFSIGFFRAAHLSADRFFPADEAVVLRAIQTDAFGIFSGEGLRHLPANINGYGRVTTGTGVIEITSQPSMSLYLLRITSRLPNLGRAKMGAIGIGIAHSLYHSQLAGVVQLFQSGEIRVKGELVVEFQNLIFSDADAWTCAMIKVVAIRNGRVESIIPSRHLQHDQDVGIVPGCRLSHFIGSFGLQGRKRICEESRDGPGNRATKNSCAQKFAARLKRRLSFHK